MIIVFIIMQSLDSDKSSDRVLSSDSVFITKLDNLITYQNNKVLNTITGKIIQRIGN